MQRCRGLALCVCVFVIQIMQECMNTYVLAYKHRHTYISLNIQMMHTVHTYIHTHIHTYIRTHIH
jgi:hypothetical protein